MYVFFRATEEIVKVAGARPFRDHALDFEPHPRKSDRTIRIGITATRYGRAHRHESQITKKKKKINNKKIPITITVTTRL